MEKPAAGAAVRSRSTAGSGKQVAEVQVRSGASGRTSAKSSGASDRTSAKSSRGTAAPVKAIARTDGLGVTRDAALHSLSAKPIPNWRVAQARLVREGLERIADTYGLLDAAMVSQLVGSSARNPSVLTTKWRKSGLIIGFAARGRYLYPGFQFDLVAGQPLAAMKQLIELWGADDPVGLALWCAAPNDWLAGAAPADRLSVDPETVIAAVREAASA